MKYVYCKLLLGACLLACNPGVQSSAQTQPPPATPAQKPSPDPASPPDVTAGDRIEAKALADAIQESASPLVLYVGPRTFFDQAHILASEYIGAVGTEAGLDALRKRVAEVKKDRWIVVYCGCCPWDRCPNVRPAWNELHTLGFTHVQALYLPNNFGADWVDKGFPIER